MTLLKYFRSLSNRSAHEGVAGAHIVLSSWWFLAAVWHRVYLDPEILFDGHTGK